MLLLLLTLVAVPIAARYWARHHVPRHTLGITGSAVGSVISPLSLGIYAAAPFLGPFGLPLVFVGLPSAIFHGTPGFHIASSLGVIPPGVVEGVSRLYVELINAVVWAPMYGAVGWLLDRFRASRTSSSAL